MTEPSGRIVRRLREEAQLDLHALAEQVRLAPDVLEAFEEGRSPISTAARDRIAYELAVDPIALGEGKIVRKPNATLFFRQGSFPDFRDDEDRPKVAEALERAMALLEVNEILGRAKSLRSRFEPEEPGPEAYKDGYRLAWRVRAALGNETEPMPETRTLLEEVFDVLVLVEPLATTSIHALTIMESTRGAAAVILNASSSRRTNPWADRVDLLHELAHVLFDPANDEVNLIVEEEDKRATALVEQRAGAFAAEMLMPQRGLRCALGEPRYEMTIQAGLSLVERAREEFMAPIELTVNHLVNREYIWSALRERIIADARSSGVAEPAEPVSLSRPNVLVRRVVEALKLELITRMKARELLGISAWDGLPELPADR